MARDYGRIKITIWQDEDFAALSTKAQQLYFYLTTQSRLDMSGVVQWRPRMAAKSARDLTHETVTEALQELEAGHYVLFDEETDELLVRSFIRNDDVLRSPNLAVAMVKAWRGIDSEILRQVISFEVDRLANEDSSLKGLDKCEELLGGLFSDPRKNPFGKGFMMGSDKGCRTTTTTSATLTTTTTSATDDATQAAFAEFWSTFPPERRSNKPGCQKKFAQAAKTETPEKIITAAAAYRDDPNREATFTVGPHRWLSEARWDDGPLPQRQGSSSDQRLARGFQMVQQVIEREAPSNEFPEFPSDPRLMELER